MRDPDFPFVPVFLLSFLLGLLGSHCTTVPLGEAATQDRMLHWVEKCWPNKPVWGSQSMACWVNGRKVLVD